MYLEPGSIGFAKNQYEDSNAEGPCRELATSIGIWEYLEIQKGTQRLTGDWRHLKQMEQTKPSLMFYLDTEFAGNKLIKLGNINANGDQVINILVVYDQPWSRVYEEGDERTRA